MTDAGEAGDAGRGDAVGDADTNDAGTPDRGDTDATNDAGTPDLIDDGGAAATPFVDFANPAAAVVYTNGPLAVQIATSSIAPDAVDVLVDHVATLHLLPPFTGSLPTAALPEGTHALDCRAMFAGTTAVCVTRMLVVDRTPPKLIATTPFQNEYAAASELIAATFNEPIAAAPVTAARFQVLADSAALATTPALSSDGRTLTSGVTTHPARATGTAIIAGTITDLAGNAMGQNAVWTWHWADAISLGPSLNGLLGESGGYNASIAVGADGLPVVAWTTEGTTTSPARMIVQRWDGAHWTMLGSFPDQPTLLVGSSVAVDRSGRVLMAWTDQDQNAGTFVTHVRVQNGSGWDAWDDLPMGYRPHLVVDDAGDVSLSLIANSPSPTHTAVFRRSASGWQPLGDLMIPATAQLSSTGGMAGDASGTLVLEWSDQVGSVQFVPRVRLWTSGTWQSQSLPPAQGLGYLGLLPGMSRAGVAAYAWDEQTIPMPSVVAVFVPGWVDRRVVDGFSATNLLDIDVDPTGQPLVTFAQTTPRTLQVERWSGSAWEAVFDQIQVNPIPQDSPLGMLALDDNGKPFLVVQERTGGHPVVYVVSKP